MIDPHHLRENLREMMEMSRRDVSVDQLWIHVGALTAIVEQILNGLIEMEGSDG